MYNQFFTPELKTKCPQTIAKNVSVADPDPNNFPDLDPIFVFVFLQKMAGINNKHFTGVMVEGRI